MKPMLMLKADERVRPLFGWGVFSDLPCERVL